MSKQHDTKVIRWVCEFLRCDTGQTGIVPVKGGQRHKLQCVKCGAFSDVRNVLVVKEYKKVWLKGPK